MDRALLPPLLVSAASLLLAACAASPRPGAPAGLPGVPPLKEHGVPESPIDVLHYGIELDLDPSARTFEGRTRVEFRAREALHALELELDGLAVRSVHDGEGRALSFRHRGARLAIELAEPLAKEAQGEVHVAYGGAPHAGLWFSGDDGNGGASQVFTQGQAEDSSAWFPCYDHPSDRATSSVSASVPAAWATVGAGVLSASEALGERRRDTWSMQTSHPCYLVTFLAGDLGQARGLHGDVELLFLAPEELLAFTEPLQQRTSDILAFLEELTGLSYPYPKYAQSWVDNFPWGGMENISATTLTPLALTDERGRRDGDALDLYVHEAAHQWFGDLFTCNDWSHAWLNEGFATYAECLWEERERGADAARVLVRRYQESWLAHAAEELQPTVSARYREADDLFDADIYDGAAVRIDHLRFVLGDEAFFRCLKVYAAENAGKNVDTEIFQRTFERVCGQDLSWFFEQWFQSPGYPEFAVAWEYDPRAGRVLLLVEQVQSTAGGVPSVFRTPVDVEVRDSEGVVVQRLEIDEASERFELAARSAPLYVCFDKGSRIPKAMRWHDTVGEWRALAAGADDPTARVDAARALGRVASATGAQDGLRADVSATLVALLDRDPMEWVRAEAAQALGAMQGSGATAALREAADTDPAASVRVAALKALATFGPDRETAAFAEAIFEQSYSYATMGAAALLYAAANPRHAVEWIEERLERPSPHDALTGHLIDVLAELDDPRALDICRRLAADRELAPATRAVAVRRLGASREAPSETARLLTEICQEPSFALQSACIEALAEQNSGASRSSLREYYPRAQGGGQRRAIEDALAGRP
jgi:aminopeptidase N